MAPTGTWVIEELRLAVQEGYRILEVSELYEYNMTRYDLKLGKATCLQTI